MDKPLVEIDKEIKELEQERQKENMNRLNAFGPIFRIQEELGGSIFGITFPKNIHEFDNEDFDRVVSTLLEKMNNMSKLYANPSKYLPGYFEKETYGLSNEKFEEYSNEIRTSLKAIKVSNSKLDGIWNKQMQLGQMKSAKTDEKNTVNSVPAIKVQIDNFKAEIEKLEKDIEVNQILMQNASSDVLKNVYASAITETKKLIASKKRSITALYKIVSKEDIAYYENMMEEEKKLDEERRTQEELEKQEAEKRAKFEDVRRRKEEAKINQELDEAEYGKTEAEQQQDTPQAALDDQIKVDTTPEEPKKPKLITRAGELLKKAVNNNIVKSVAVIAATVAGLAVGMTFVPGVILGAGGYYAYKEVKKGMGK